MFMGLLIIGKADGVLWGEGHRRPFILSAALAPGSLYARFKGESLTYFC
jgi:hypothetical protein